MDLSPQAAALCALAAREDLPAQARELYRQAWDASADDYDRCVVAHHLAGVQESPQEALRWHLEALGCADQVDNARVAWLYPTLYVGIALVYEQLGELTPARGAFLQAKQHSVVLADAEHADAVRAGVSEGLRRLGVRSLATVILVNRAGEILLQLRDGNAPNYPHRWGLPGGHIEPGEEPEPAARRELLEETALELPGPLALFAHQLMPENAFEKYYFCAITDAAQEDVVLGEGEAMVFTAPDGVLDGRAYTPGTVETLTRFLGSNVYDDLLAG